MSAPTLRRSDREMANERLRAFVAGSRVGRLSTFGPDGYPYCVPLLFVATDDAIYVHNTAARGHLLTNVEHCDRVCFELDDAGDVFDYGRFECDSSIAYASVILFGRISIETDRAAKQLFCERLMMKYGTGDTGRPAGFYPRLDQITVYAIAIERVTGKELALPALGERWPAKDSTRTPNARPSQ